MIPSCGETEKGNEVTTITSNSDIELLSKKSDTLAFAFENNNIDSFNQLITSDGLYVISLYGGMGIVETSSKIQLSLLQIKDGILMTKDDPAVDPPEQELGITSEAFNSKSTKFSHVSEEGIIENIDWNDMDYDYLTAHFNDIYFQLVWICENSQSENGWIFYKLPNDTYIYSNGHSWFSKNWNSRVFEGQSFVLKLIDNDYKIVAFINTK